MVAYAGFNGFVTKVNTFIVNPIIEILFAIALVIFLWGVLEFLFNLDNDEKRSTGKSHMLWGFVGFLIMFGVFTIMNMLIKTFNIQGVNPEEGKVELRI